MAAVKSSKDRGKKSCVTCSNSFGFSGDEAAVFYDLRVEIKNY